MNRLIPILIVSISLFIVATIALIQRSSSLPTLVTSSPTPIPTTQQNLPNNNQTTTWEIYQLPQLNLKFKLPTTVNPSKTITFTTSHSDLFWNDQPDKLIKLYASSTKSTFEGAFTYLHGCVGYKKSGSIYKFLTYVGGSIDMPAQTTEENVNPQNVQYLIVTPDPQLDYSGLPPIGVVEKDNIAALIKTNNKDYPILVIQMKLSDIHNKELFDQILSSFIFNN